jgi:predicted ATPase/class 3 adenylate cyclase
MNCSGCGHENTASAKFCSECGARLRATCPQCGTDAAPTAKFCQECGTALSAPAAAPAAATATSLEEHFQAFQRGLPQSFREQLLTGTEGENRIVTVLFADMSSCVRTTRDLHPEDAADLVNRLLKVMVDALLKYDGRVDRFLGDGVLAVFGAPHSHESDPERAILAALEIREAARTLGLETTAGINTGEVYVGGVGSERHQEVTVMGPVVNLAARLQGRAEPGQVLVGEATHRLTRRAFAFTSQALEIKGIAGPVTAYAADKVLPRPEKVRGIEGLRAELIGRDEEMAQLHEALQDLRRGRGQMVSLIGEAGVGKSRLVNELKAACGGSVKCEVLSPNDVTPNEDPSTLNTQHSTLPALWLEGRCLELGMAASYWPFLDLLREYFGWRQEDNERARAESLVASLRDLVEGGELSEARFEEIVPLLGNLLTLRFGNEWDERLKSASPEQIRYRTFAAIRDLFIVLSRRRPLVLVFDDLHWSDSLSLDLISLLMETVTFTPILMLCIYRPEQEHKCWHLGMVAARKCPDRYTAITLRELSPEQSRRLIEALLTIENLSPTVKATIQERSGGNPFFVEEVIRSLIDTGMVYREGGAWRAREGIEGLSVPESIQSVIQSRVDRLEQDLRHVLQSAAVIGRLFQGRLLGQVMQKEGELERALWELEDLALIYQEQVIPEPEYSFKHALTQETVYQNILRRRRGLFHQQVAAAMEAVYDDSLEQYYEQLAHHYDQSGVDDKAVEYLLKAGDKARRAYLGEEAVRYFQRALQRLEGSALGAARPDWRLQALQGLGQSYEETGRLAEAEERFRQAITVGREMALPAREIVRLFYWLGQVLHWQSRHEERLRLGEEGLALLGEDTESVEAVLMNHAVARGCAAQGDPVRRREFASRNAAILDCLPYSEELRPSYVDVIMLAATEDRDEEVARWLEALEQAAAQHHDLRALGEVHNLTGMCLLRPRGDLQGALARHERALEIFARIGDANSQRWCLGLLRQVALALGELRKAEEYAERGLRAAEDVSDVRDQAHASVTLGTVALCEGAYEKATAAFAQATCLYRDVSPSMAAWGLQCLGRACLAQGDREAAMRHFQEAITLEPNGPTSALSGLEEACEDAAEFRALCRRWRAERPQAGTRPGVQWFLEPAELRIGLRRTLFDLRFDTAARCQAVAESLRSQWTWHDPCGDGAFTVEDGLTLRAPNGRDLAGRNMSAPRLLRPVSGDLAVQATCTLTRGQSPTIGGILLWKDRENYLRLERGTRGRHEICFRAVVGGKSSTVGRGRLALSAQPAADGAETGPPIERVFLRLERLKRGVDAFCSADGQQWFTLGYIEFPVEDPIEIGLYASGMLERVISPGAYPEGTAIRFEAFQVWV